MIGFLDILRSTIDQRMPLRLTASKPRVKSADLRNVYVRTLKDGSYLVTLRYKTKDEAKSVDGEGLLTLVKEYLERDLLLADLLLEEETISLLQSKKGAVKVLRRKTSNDVAPRDHDRQKERLIPADTAFLHKLGIASADGKIYDKAQDKFRQINKYAEIVSGLFDGQEIDKIYDMGSGKGYLTFALATVLGRGVSITGVELRADLVDKCNKVAYTTGYDHVQFVEGSIDSYAVARADAVIALHACDVATDMAIAAGVKAGARWIIVSPCCHKQIRRAMTKTDSPSSPILTHGIHLERMAELITDTIRALLLESRGYRTKIFEFIASDHTGKNLMITATYTGKPDLNALSQVAALKREYGISEHYLEGLL